MATAMKTEIVSLSEVRAHKVPHSTTRDLSAAFWATQANFLLGVVGTGQAPTDAKRPVGVISLIGGYGGLHPL